MNEPRPVGFYVGQIEDGRYAAASTSAPYFCFVDASEDKAIEKVNAALDFYFSHQGVVTTRPSTSKNVVHFVPQRRIETLKEYTFA